MPIYMHVIPFLLFSLIIICRGVTEGELAFPEETFHHEAEVVLMIGSPIGMHASMNVGTNLELSLCHK